MTETWTVLVVWPISFGGEKFDVATGDDNPDGRGRIFFCGQVPLG